VTAMCRVMLPNCISVRCVACRGAICWRLKYCASWFLSKLSQIPSSRRRSSRRWIGGKLSVA